MYGLEGVRSYAYEEKKATGACARGELANKHPNNKKTTTTCFEEGGVINKEHVNHKPLLIRESKVA